MNAHTTITTAQAEAVEVVARRRMGAGRNYNIADGEVFWQALALQDKLAGHDIEASDDALYQAIEETNGTPDYYAAIRGVALQVAA